MYCPRLSSKGHDAARDSCGWVSTVERRFLQRLCAAFENCALNNSHLYQFRGDHMIYRHIASSERAFVQQLAVAYVSNGYWYYVTGCIPEHKDVLQIDEKLMGKYHVAISKWARARRKQQGLANVQYLRHQRFFIIIATRGLHRFFDEEGRCVKDIRREPVHFAGYSISYRRGVDRKWHASVRIHPVEYNQLKNHLVDMATCRSVQSMCREFEQIPFEPYAPVRRQLLNILRAVNRSRKSAGYEPVPVSAMRLSRRVVRPFEHSATSWLTERTVPMRRLGKKECRSKAREQYDADSLLIVQSQ